MFKGMLCIFLVGKVLVHCREGISRSATILTAFLVIKRDYSLMDALKLLREKRAVFPNCGFCDQLIKLYDHHKQSNSVVTKDSATSEAVTE